MQLTGFVLMGIVIPLILSFISIEAFFMIMDCFRARKLPD